MRVTVTDNSAAAAGRGVANRASVAANALADALINPQNPSGTTGTEGESNVVPFQQIFPVMPHPVPGGVINLFDEWVEVELVIVRRAGYLQ